MVLATAAFVALPLPSGCDVPTGALNSTGVMSKRNELLLRSRATVSLAAQLRDLQEDCAIVDRELESEAAPVLDTCFSSGLFKKGGYKNRAAQHPAWQAGLKAAAGVLMAKRGALMSEAAAAFLSKKQEVLLRLRVRYGEPVHVPQFFFQNNFVDESERTVQLQHAHCSYRLACDHISNHLNVMRLPVMCDGQWRRALLPNLVGMSDADMIEQVSAYYQLEAARSRMGASLLTRDDVCNLKATLPVGSGMRTLVDFLIAKFADDETRRVLGYTPGRVKSLVGRYDEFIMEKRGLRAEAELKVAGKIIKTTGEGVKDVRRAVDHEMRRLVLKDKLLTEVARKARAPYGWKTDKEFIDIIKAVVRGMGETSSKGARGATPTDEDLFVAEAFGMPGGKVDRIYAAVRAAVKARFGSDISRSTVYSGFKRAGIKFASNIGLMEPVLQQHYCRARVLLYTWLFLPFSADSVILSIDQKALYKANCDRAKGKDVQIMSERARWGVTNKGSGFDTLCSLALFSIWLLPIKNLEVEKAARDGFGAWLDVLAQKFGWTEAEFGEREGFAAAFGYVAAGKELKPEQCSHEVPVEKCNGQIARRTRGSMVTFKAESADPLARANESLRTLCDRAHGATFNGGGGCIDVLVAADVDTSFPWDAKEQKSFLSLSVAADRVAFVSKHEAEWPGISDLYRSTYDYQFGLNTDSHLLFFHDIGACIWRKREGCQAHEPWRGSVVQRKMLDAWRLGVPPSLVPSQDRPTSYARPAERFRRLDELEPEGKPPVEPDAFNPRKLMDTRWKQSGLKQFYLEKDGALPEEVWARLEVEMLTDRKTLKHDLAHLAALARGDEKALSLATAQKARGVDTAVEAFVRRTVKETVTKDDGTAEVRELGNVNKPHLVQALLALAAAKTGMAVPDKKKLDALRKASLVQMVYETAQLSTTAHPPANPPAAAQAAAQATAQAAAVAAQAAAAQAVAVLAHTTVAAAARVPTPPLPPTVTAAGSSDEAGRSDAMLSNLAKEVEAEDAEAAAHGAAGEAAAAVAAEQRLGDDAAVAQAAGEEPDPDAQDWGSEPRLDHAKAAAEAAAATERRRAKKWLCSVCGKSHDDFALVKPLGGGYVCAADCGLVDGPRQRKAKRPRDAGP